MKSWMLVARQVHLAALKFTSSLVLAAIITAVPVVAQVASSDEGLAIPEDTRIHFLNEKLADTLAEDCEFDKRLLHVGYRIRAVSSSVLANGRRDLASSETTFNLVRKGLTVSHQHPDAGITDSWYRLKNDSTRYTRFFDKHRRGIEYDLNSSPQAELLWQSHFQVIDSSLLSALDVVEVFGNACSQIQKLEGQYAGASYQVLWMPAWQLAVYISARSSTHYTTWRVEEVNKDARKIERQQQRYAGYRMTDFADIGDNESDPFFVSMMNSGYISFATSSAHQGHSHGLPLR